METILIFVTYIWLIEELLIDSKVARLGTAVISQPQYTGLWPRLAMLLACGTLNRPC